MLRSSAAHRDFAAEPDGARIAALDRQRGLIMVLMALDHASGFIARRHAAEYWGGELTRHASALPFLTRFVTHLCAPGFFFLMGCGAELFARARRASGWTEGRIARALVIRGLLLILINQFVENPAWIVSMVFGPAPPAVEIPGGGYGPYLVTGVLTSLGLSLVTCGLLRRMGASGWLALAAACLWATSALTPAPERAAEQFSPLLRILLIPGHTDVVQVLYPWAPWLALAALGVVYARWLVGAPGTVRRWTPWIGAGLVAAALVLRAAGGFGNLRLPRDGTWIEFLNFVKYPPALVFTLCMLGVNLLLLAGFSAAGPRLGVVGRWLAVFGRTPLFFYIAHLYLYSLAGILVFRTPTSLPVMYLVWLGGLVPLGWLCERYAAFKARRPVGSVWRFF